MPYTVESITEAQSMWCTRFQLSGEFKQGLLRGRLSSPFCSMWLWSRFFGELLFWREKIYDVNIITRNEMSLHSCVKCNCPYTTNNSNSKVIVIAKYIFHFRTFFSHCWCKYLKRMFVFSVTITGKQNITVELYIIIVFVFLPTSRNQSS